MKFINLPTDQIDSKLKFSLIRSIFEPCLRHKQLLNELYCQLIVLTNHSSPAVSISNRSRSDEPIQHQHNPVKTLGVRLRVMLLRIMNKFMKALFMFSVNFHENRFVFILDSKSCPTKSIIAWLFHVLEIKNE